jgi:protein involved in polysaccharide export with SLBB domain
LNPLLFRIQTRLVNGNCFIKNAGCSASGISLFSVCTTWRFIVLVLISVLSAFGQAPNPVDGGPPSENNEATFENYLLAPFDKVSLSVFDEPDLSASQRLTARGEITVPLLGTVQIGGLSIESAKSRLEALYVSNRFLRSPQVFLAIDEFSPKRITVLGQIGSPSSLELPMGANYLEIEAAIAMAGGFTDLARRSNIRVTRKDRPDGRERIMEVNMDDVLSDEKDGFATTRFRVYPGDIIYVPRRYF